MLYMTVFPQKYLDTLQMVHTTRITSCLSNKTTSGLYNYEEVQNNSHMLINIVASYIQSEC